MTALPKGHAGHGKQYVVADYLRLIAHAMLTANHRSMSTPCSWAAQWATMGYNELPICTHVCVCVCVCVCARACVRV